MRVQVAADNAAYWSISTTMKSDRMAISAVSDALGLGAAKVDTAYAGMNAVVDVLKEFKAKLVAATEDGVDRAKVQEELEQLKQQVVGISQSATFSGENWLRSDAATAPENGSVASSFVRDSSDNVAVKKTGVSLNDTILFNAEGTGILQAGHVNSVAPTPGTGSIGDIGGLLDAGSVISTGYTERYSVYFPAPVTFSPTDVVEFDVLIDAGPTYAGDAYHAVITYNDVNTALSRSDGVIEDAAALSNVFYRVLHVQQNIPAVGGTSGQTISPGVTHWHTSYLQSIGENNGIESSISISNVTSTLPAGETLGLATAPKGGTQTYARDTLPFTGPFQLDVDEGFQFEISVLNQPWPYPTLTFSRDDVQAALGNSSGVVSSASDFATLLNSKTAALGVLVTSTGSQLRFDIDTTMHPEKGHKSSFSISDIKIIDVSSLPGGSTPGSGSGTVNDGDFLAIDVTTDHDIGDYISRIEGMLQDTISGAATLGALSKRIDLQTEFTAKMMATTDKGVGRLVDADMNEASTRLKALQTQEQLAIQPLSIANTSAEHLMQLFR